VKDSVALISSMHSKDGLLDSWWEGIELWYNQAAYRSAMDVWFEAIDLRIQAKTRSPDTSFTTSSSINKARILKDVRTKCKQVDETTARFLVFLAGCALDSADINRARRYLDESLRLTTIFDGSSVCQSVDDSVAHRAAHEYSALFEEDDQCEEPQRMASELFETLFQTSRRAPFMIESINSKPYYEVGTTFLVQSIARTLNNCSRGVRLPLGTKPV
jgi:hypothetical protein